MFELNQKFWAKDDLEDFYPSGNHTIDVTDLPIDNASSVISGEDVKTFVKTALSCCRKSLSQSQLEEVLVALGLDKSSHMINKARKEQFVQGIQTLCNVHFSNHDETQYADMMGELLFNSRIFFKDSYLKATTKATTSMTNCVFNTVNIFKAIDSKAGSLNLNDTAVDEYAKIELDSPLTAHKKGKDIFPIRHYLTGAHKITNGLVDHLFKFVDEG